MSPAPPVSLSGNDDRAVAQLFRGPAGRPAGERLMPERIAAARLSVSLSYTLFYLTPRS